MVDVSKVVNYKGADYAGIKRTAKDAVRYMSNDDSRALETYRNFIRKGSDAPGYADGVMHTAIYDNAIYSSTLAAQKEIPMQDGIRKANLPMQKLKEFKLQISPKEMLDYNNNFKLLYPQSWKKRMVIASVLREPTGVMKSVKSKKFMKKLLYKMLG